MRALIRIARVAWAGIVLLGCVEHAQHERAQSQPSYGDFERLVYPILLRDCGFVACHGSAHRPLQVYGPGRTRLDPMTPPSAPATSHELEASYMRALAMLASDHGIDHSLLLTKPL